MHARGDGQVSIMIIFKGVCWVHRLSTSTGIIQDF